MNRIKSKIAWTANRQKTMTEPADVAPVSRSAASNVGVPVCPGCDTVLMAGIGKGLARGFSLRCPMCYLVCTSS